MKEFDGSWLKKLFVPLSGSHKGQNGKLMIIGGSKLFHGASLWSLKVASRIVDMVFYSSIPENNELTEKLKSDLYDFIAIPREKIEEYIEEADAVLIGPGLPREEGREANDESTKELTENLIKKYSDKKWVIDAGSLTEINPDLLLSLNGNAILTPHRKEFKMLFRDVTPNLFRNLMEGKNKMLKQVQHDKMKDAVASVAQEFNCIILLKGQSDIVCSPYECVEIKGGNAGMTKGGTGDVLSGLVAALACKNDLFLAACVGSFINKKAAEELFERVGYYFNASDLVDEIPRVMRRFVIKI